MESIPTKICTRCHRTAPATLEHWSREPKGKFGLTSRCRPCLSAIYQEKMADPVYRDKEKHRLAILREKPEQRKKVHEAYKNKCATDPAYLELERQRKREGFRKRAADPDQRALLNERQRVRKKERYQTDAEYRQKMKAVVREWQALHPAYVQSVSKAAKARRRARIDSTGTFFRASEWRAKLEAYKNRCHWCENKIVGTPHADHLIPLARGGLNNIGNIVPSCQRCNLSRQDKLPHEWTTRLL